ncbi:MAG TPA: DivIVA domain-containing protein [Candidatus Enterenecus faecium]|uniref:DivIVA domain-containing protein n=1 Tax=Candidatus Enterenecus faecium TaxID=2840780 RepID=A0A9D0YRX7_9FIRM|nr:DivIVA domain-containing protein [Candidatus Enterenecus faecium]
MMTPQEVASHVFAKATFGGYNMTMVDEFLDQLTEDYTALYNDNTILKNKLKVLSDSIEEYRATDVAMRKTLLAAQQMADSMVSDAEKKKTQLEQDATQEAQARKSKLEAEIAAEEFRLHQAQKATADYVMKLHALHQEELDYLSRLGQMVPPEMAQAAMAQSIVPEGPTTPVEDLTSEEEEVEEPTISQPLQQSQQPKNDPVDDLYLDATRRFDDLQFGKDYQIK